MSMNTALEVDAQFSEGGKPSVSSLDDPAMSAKAVIAFNASAGNPIFDATTFEMVSTASEACPEPR